MKATDWEFRQRAAIFGTIFGVSFALYTLDPLNATAALADMLSIHVGLSADSLARLLLTCAAALVIVAAWLRTWASAHLRAAVVYAADVKTGTLIADGPYRLVRNPLYLANVLLAVSLGSMMSRVGCILAIVAMLVFCYRLILREEFDLRVSQGEPYRRYCKIVPRLWPALRPRVASGTSRANWSAAFKAEFWYWGIAAAVATFAVTEDQTAFFVILGASVAVFWVSSWLLAKHSTKI